MQNTLPATSGIYRIQIGPRTFYWGQAQNLRKREVEHRTTLARGKHDNSRLQRAWDKYGGAAFNFHPQHLCAVWELDALEQRALDEHFSDPRCANLAPTVGASTRGMRHTDKTRALMRAAKRRYRYVVKLSARVEVYETLRELAQAFGVSESAARSWTKGQRNPHPKHNIASIERVDKS